MTNKSHPNLGFGLILLVSDMIQDEKQQFSSGMPSLAFCQAKQTEALEGRAGRLSEGFLPVSPYGGSSIHLCNLLKIENYCSFAYVTAASEHAFNHTMNDQDLDPVPAPTDGVDGHSAAESSIGKNKHPIDENTVSRTSDSSGNQAKALGISDTAALPAPSPPNPNQDAEAEVHETAEPDGYYPQTLDVSRDKARCL